MAACYVYILACSDGSFYTGSTKYLALRLRQHQEGSGAAWTAKRLPVSLVYSEQFTRIDWAFNREHQLKKWSRRKKLALIERNEEDLHQCAICRNATRIASLLTIEAEQQAMLKAEDEALAQLTNPPRHKPL